MNIIKYLYMYFLIMLISSCYHKSYVSDEAMEEHTVLVEDQLGRSVFVQRHPKKITVGTIFPYVSTWYVATHSTKEIIGMHPSSYDAALHSMLSKLSPEVLSGSTQFFRSGELNVEELLSLNTEMHIENALLTKSIEKLQQVGVPSIALKAMNAAYGDPFETFLSWLLVTNNITETDDRIEKFSQISHQVKDEIRYKVQDKNEHDRPRAMFLYSHGERDIRVAGSRSWGNYWISAAGGVDVAESEIMGIQSVGMEQIYRWNPDVILISNFTESQPKDIFANQIKGQDWSVLEAVRTGKVYKVPLGIYRWFTPSGDAPLMLKWIAQILYPSQFHYDMSQEIIQYYKDFYDYEVSENEIKTIFLHNQDDMFL